APLSIPPIDLQYLQDAADGTGTSHNAHPMSATSIPYPAKRLTGLRLMTPPTRRRLSNVYRTMHQNNVNLPRFPQFSTAPMPRYAPMTSVDGGQETGWRSRPVSRVLSWATIPLGASSPIRSSNLPGPGAGNAMRSLFGLAPGGVCRAGLLPGSRCALTAPFHPCHASRRTVRRYLSVALSVGSRRPGVTWHRALWSPDFPRHPS